MLTRQEAIDWVEKERVFLATDIGRAFSKFKVAYSQALRAEFDEKASGKMIGHWEKASSEAEKALKLLMGWGRS